MKRTRLVFVKTFHSKIVPAIFPLLPKKIRARLKKLNDKAHRKARLELTMQNIEESW